MTINFSEHHFTSDIILQVGRYYVSYKRSYCEIEEALSLSLQNQVKAQIAKNEEIKKVNQSRLINEVLHKAYMLDEGDEFSITKLLSEAWAKVDSHKAFGRSIEKS